MATDKKHIAVYLDPAVEQALIAFCEQKGLISKKGFMYSAGVNAALAEFFGIADIEASNIPPNSSNILGDPSNTLNNLRNIPATSASNIPAGDNIPATASNIPVSNIPAGDNIRSDIGNILPRRDNIPATASNIPSGSSNILLKSLVMEVLPGKQKA
jgi:hypothetical protein